MGLRVICPVCGKLNRISDETTAGETVVCLACGGRIVVEPDAVARDAIEPAAEPVAAQDEDVTDVPESEPRPARARTVPTHAPRRAATFVVGLIAGGIVSAAVVVLMMSSDRKAAAELNALKTQAEATSDLVALKSEAEQLAIEGKLEEAHAKYRELQKRAIGRTIKDGLNWDVMERAQVDQDRIYTLLLDRAQAANPPDKAIPPPGSGTSTRADDPWFWPRVGNGGRAGTEPTTNEAVAEAPVAAQPPLPEESAPPPPSPAVAQTEPTAVAKVDPAGQRPPVDNTRAEAPTPPRWVQPGTVTDEQIGFSIKLGVDYLLGSFKDDALAPIADMTGVKYAGRNALAVYALLTAYRATNDPRIDPRGEFMSRVIDKMKSHRLVASGKEPMQPVVYARSIRAAALAMYNRPQDRAVLKEDAEWLMHATIGGAYSYDDRFVNLARQANAAGATDEPSEIDLSNVFASDDLTWDDDDDAPVIFCDGLHDRSGREITRMRPNTKSRLPPPPGGGPPGRTPPPNMPPPGQGRTQGPGGMGVPPPPPGATRWQPPRQPVPMPDMNGPSGNDPNQFPWDNSNSQYGLLGVWAAAEAGIEVPRKYWEDVQKHWEQWQFKSGQWGYIANDRAGTYAMTCGGVASLWVTYDWLVAPKAKGQVGRETMTPNMQAGMKWLESADNGVNTPIPGQTHYPGYDLYALERVGLASGYKYFGSHDWYRELAAKSIARQFDNGAWGRDDRHPDGLIETSYEILFLSHGRLPILMNKLRFTAGRGETIGGKPIPAYWSNRPRDVANLTRFASHEFERPFNWQVVDLSRPWSDWLDSPVLFIASHTPPAFTDADYAKLRAYAEAGGLIFTHADAGAAPFTRWITEELIPKTFPGRKAELLPEDHPIYSLNYNLKKPRPQLYGVSNGARLLLIHSPTDLATAWQQRAAPTQAPLFQLGLHVFYYAAGKADFRNRIDSPYVPPAPEGKAGAVSVARVKYNGDWDPEPGAWRRFANLYQWEMDTTVKVSEIDMSTLDAKATPVAHLTGIRAGAFTDAEANALHKYVEAGGIILIDACGGSPAFDASIRDTLLAKAFPGAVLQAIPKDHPLLAEADGPPMTLRYRTYVADKLKTPAPPLEQIKFGKGAVIVSHVDITSGLLGTNTLTVVGYDAPLAQAVVWNLLGWAGAGPAVQSSTAP